jgi:hypothetical protein
MILPLSLILGAALGVRFKVKILLPVQALAMVAVCSALRSEPEYLTVYTNILVCVCLQAGYIAGAMGRDVTGATWFDREFYMEHVD